MNFSEFLILIFAVVTSGTGQLFLKSGALKLGQVTTENAVSHIVSMITVPEIFYPHSAYFKILLKLL